MVEDVEEERENSTVSPLSPISSHCDISAVQSLVTQPSALVLGDCWRGGEAVSLHPHRVDIHGVKVSVTVFGTVFP